MAHVLKVRTLVNPQTGFIILLLAFLCSGIHSNAQKPQGIHFKPGTLAKILATAQKEKKLVFVDCYTTWCGPCKWMEENIYVNDTVAVKYNSLFINAKINMEKGEGVEIAKKYNISAYPTLLYLDTNGRVLHRVCGAKNVSEIIEAAEIALNPKKQISEYSKQLNTGKITDELAYTYFRLLENACLPVIPQVKKYLSMQKTSNLTTPFNWKIINEHVHYSWPTFKELEKNKNAFAKLYTIDSVDKKLETEYTIKLQEACFKGDADLYKILKKRFKTLNTKNYDQIIKHTSHALDKLPNADMQKAIEITDSIIPMQNVSLGRGEVQEVYFNTKYNERYSAWYKLEINADTLLTFDIVPNDSVDDYDFMIFKSTGPNFLNEMKSKPIKPVRLCYSYFPFLGGCTGLSKYTKESFIPAGFGSPYASALPVKKGETYYLLVNFVFNHLTYFTPVGYTIYFYNYWPRKKPTVFNNVLFENNKSELSKEAIKELDDFAERIRITGLSVEIRGFADGIGDAEKNQKLSEQRAKAVADYLKTKKIDARRLFYKGMGSLDPVASDKTKDGRQKNRRVEFILFY